MIKLRKTARATVLLAGVLGVVGSPGRGAVGLRAQETPEARVLAVIDYVAGADLYLAVGADHGILESDTLPVYDGDGEGARFLGIFLIVSGTDRRSVANIVGERFGVERGEVVYLGVPADRLAEAVASLEDAESPAIPPGGGEGARIRDAEVPRPPTRFNGRVSLDYDAYRTTTRWGEGPDAEESRSFNTPTFRLQARGRNLPGGFSLGTGVRVSHRMSSDDIVRPVTSTRLYQLDLEKRFESFPLELHLGRFNSPFDEFSGFWDGMLLRMGPRGFGGGLAVGFEPRWSDEGFGSDRPKALGFVDFDARGERVDYSGTVTVLGIRPRNGLPDRTSLGLSQRVRFGRVWIHERLEVDRNASGSTWDVTRIQVDGSLRLVGGLEAFGGWRRWRYVPLWSPGAGLGPTENRGRVGLSLWGRAGGGSVDLSLDRPDEGENGRTVSGSFYLLRTPIPGIGLGGSVSHWSRGEDSSLLLSPELRASLGSITLRGGHRFYRILTRGTEVTTQFSDVSLTFPVGGGVSLRIQGSTQWGGDLTSNRIYASLWKGF